MQIFNRQGNQIGAVIEFPYNNSIIRISTLNSSTPYAVVSVDIHDERIYQSRLCDSNILDCISKAKARIDRYYSLVIG